REAAHRDAVQTKVEHFLRARWIGQRHADRLDDLVRIAGDRRGLGAMVVAGEREYAPRWTGARPIGVTQRVDGAIHAGCLAVPDSEDAVDLALGLQADVLRSRDCRCREFLVETGPENDVESREQIARLPEREIVLTKR